MDIKKIISQHGKEIVVGVITAIYLSDCVYVYNYLHDYYNQFDEIMKEDVENDEVNRDSKNNADVTTKIKDKIKQEEVLLYKLAKDEDFLITRDMFEKRLDDFSKELDENGYSDIDGIYPNLDGILMKVGRESVGFGGGARAAILQLYHPFISKGIDMHSNLAYGIQKRFYNTFKYVFAMNFGTRQDAFNAARTVRSIHDNVKGEMGEETGVFIHSSKYDASQTAAIMWVAATLVETLIFEYEMVIKKLTKEEKDEIIKQGGRLGAMFGIPHELTPKSYNEFLKYNYIIWNSDICVSGPTTERIIDFLLESPTIVHYPLLYLLRWKTAITMPPKFGATLLRRQITFIDKIIFALLMGQVRFIYRLLPGSFRFLTPYLNKERRLGVQRSPIENVLSYISAKIANIFLVFAMPPRDPKKIKASLKEIEQRNISKKLNHNSEIL